MRQENSGPFACAALALVAWFTSGCDLSSTSSPSTARRASTSDGDNGSNALGKKKDKGSGSDSAPNPAPQGAAPSINPPALLPTDNPETLSGLTKSDALDANIVDYPVLTFSGAGYTTYKLDDHLDMGVVLVTNLDQNHLTLNTQKAKIQCGNLGGCNQDEVDDSVRTKMIGANVFVRPGHTELTAFKQLGFKIVPTLIFATQVQAKNGHSFTFSQPLPVFPIPAGSETYAGLASGGPLTWSATVKSDKRLAMRPGTDDDQDFLNRMGPNPDIWLDTFNVSVVVTVTPMDATHYKLAFDLTINEDKQRMLYKAFPVNKHTETTIDTSAHNIVAANLISWTNGDKSREEEESNVNFQLCTKTLAGNAQNFPCSPAPGVTP